MKRTFYAVLSIAALALASCGQSYQSTLENEAQVAETTDVAAALVFAEWCPSCKVLDPKVEAVRASLDRDDVSFVLLDYTNRNSEDFFAQADAAGIGKAVRAKFEAGVSTGQLLLIDIGSQTVEQTITRTASADDIRASILALAE